MKISYACIMRGRCCAAAGSPCTATHTQREPVRARLLRRVPELYCQEVTCTAVILAALDTLPGFNVCDKAAHAL